MTNADESQAGQQCVGAATGEGTVALPARLLCKARNQNRRGAAAVAMILTMVAASLVMVGMVLGGARDQDLTVQRMTSVRGFYAAESGMNMAIREAVGGQDHDGDGTIGGITSSAASRNVLGGAHHDVTATKVGNTFTLTSLGSLAQSRSQIQSQVTAASTSRFAKGVSLSANVEMSNSARIDAFDSSEGTYNPGTNSSGLADVATNTTSNGGVKLSNTALINGHVETGVGSNPDSVVTTNGSSTVTGSKTALDEPMSLDDIETPNPLPASSGDLTLSSNSTTTWAAGTYHYDNVSISNSHIRLISGSVVVYCDDEFTLSNNAKILLNAGATLTVYAKEFSFLNFAELNMPPSPGEPNPANVTLYHYGTGDYKQSNNGVVVAAVIAPDAEVELSNGTKLFGAIQAKSLKMSNSARFTQDLALAGSGGGTGGSGAGGSTIAAWAQIAP